MKQVVVIGGGFAGLAAAVDLASRGYAATVLEARPRLGGRAYSFRDEPTGQIIDNGQHALMGCYRHTLAFLERIGATTKLTRQSDLCVQMVHPQRGAGAITGAPLPSPLHVLGGILRYRLLTRSERLAALRAGLQIMTMRRRRDARLAAWTVAELLSALGQSANARAAFWDPVALATLNESPERAAAAPFAEVLARAFFRSRADSQFLLPNVGLSDLYTGDAQAYVEAHGGRIELKTTAAELLLSENRIRAVRLRDGSELAADAVIAAVPPKALAPLLTNGLRVGSLTQLDLFESSPIISVHLWFDRAVLTSPFVGLIGTTTQWAFNRTLLTAGREQALAGKHELQCLSAVISAGREIVEWPAGQIAEQVQADLRALLPAAREARLLQSVVVKEKHATISCTPAAEALRPRAITGVENLFFAGDWIHTELPPTIESAVCSGQQAAELAARNLERSGRHVP